MAVTTVASSTFIRDCVLFIRDDLLANVTDPLSGKRVGNEKFVMTSYPQRGVRYPIISVRLLSVSNPAALGQQSVLKSVTLPVEVRVWARNEVEKDGLSQAVINRLNNIQFTVGGSEAANLHDHAVTSAVNVDEEGDAGVKSRVIQAEYMFILGA